LPKPFDPDNFVILSCKAAMPFTQRVIDYLKKCNSHSAKINEKITMGQIKTSIFPGGEPKAKLETNVRRKTVHLFQCFRHSDEAPLLCYDVVELLVVLDMLKRSKVDEIFLYMPFLPFQRQEKKKDGREPISAKLIFDLIATAGGKKVEDIVTTDLHEQAEEGFSDDPVDNLISWPIFASYIQQKLKLDPRTFVVVSPDAGGTARAKSFAKRLGTSYAIINKIRDEDGSVIAEDVVGNVEDKIPVMIDDIIGTGSSTTECQDLLIKHGANKEILYAFATHGLFCKDKKKVPAEKKFYEHNIQIITTDSIPEKHQRYYDTCYKWLKDVLTLSPYFSDAIYCNETGMSLSNKIDGYEKQVKQNYGNIQDFLIPLKPLEICI